MPNTRDRNSAKTLVMSATVLAVMTLQVSAEPRADTKTPPGSLGPSLGAIPVPDPATDTLKVTMLLGSYGGGAAPRDGGYFMAGGTSGMGKQPDSPAKGCCTGSDRVRSTIFIDTPHKHGVIVFCRLQLGRIGYDYGAVTAAGNAQWWYFYDPKDLGGVAKGTIKPGTVVPRTRERMLLPDGSPLPGSPVTGSCYDAEAKLLYIYGPSSGRCIHVLRLKDSRQREPEKSVMQNRDAVIQAVTGLDVDVKVTHFNDLAD